MKFTIYHNPRCRKSREALSILNDNNAEVEIIEYLKEVPTEKDLELLLNKLNLKPVDLVRKEEKVFKEKFKGMEFNDWEWIKILVEHPELIQRPVIVRGNKAIIGRPPELVNELL
jgi:arsenate reductase (glutaredoxin)